MSDLARLVAALELRNREMETLLRTKYGWYPFTSHADRLDLRFEFYGRDANKLPLFERVCETGGETYAEFLTKLVPEIVGTKEE